MLRKNTIRYRAVKIALLALVVFLKISPQYLVAQKTSQRSSANASLPKVHFDGQYFVRDGKRFFPGWPVGAEVAGPNGQSGWIGQEIPAANGAGAWTSYGFNFLRYMAPWMRSAGGEMDAAQAFRDFDIDKDPPRAEELRQILDATDPDLYPMKPIIDRRDRGK